MTSKDKIHLIATMGFGIEKVTSRELRRLGYTDQAIDNGRITFSGDMEAIARTNMWLRTAERVLVKVGEFKALTFDDLFEGTKALPWEDWIGEDSVFPVIGKSVDSKLASVPDCQSIVKKAIVERLKQRYRRQWFDEDGRSVYRVEVGLLKDMATLSIDTSGTGLHKRGYRKLVSEAPVRETLAAAMLSLSHWNPERVLWDPFCGSGTIPIEGALISRNMAPGLNRTFAAQTWDNMPLTIWKRVREEALSLVLQDKQTRIYGTDIDDEVLSLARYHGKIAGVEGDIHFQRMDFRDMSSRFEHGIIVCNPPYGERMDSMDGVENLYKDMGKIFRKFDTWSCYVLTSHPGFEKLFGKRADRRRKLYNGMIMCNYYQYFGPPPARRKNDYETL